MKKYNGTEWVDTTLRQYKTATADIEPTIYTDGTAITSYAISGNTVQNGTPSLDNPIMPRGTGERTGNLLNPAIIENGYNINTNGNIVVDNRRIATTQPIDVSSENTVTLTYSYEGSTINCIYAVFSGDTMVDRYVLAVSGTAIDVSGGDKLYLCWYRGSETITKDNISNLMLNSGSTPLPYEPYGYKIPISNGQQTIDIYIGDLPLLKSLDGTAVDEISNGTLTRRVDSDGSVLPTPTTTQITMPSIPTTEGANAITVDTTVQPSEFTATWTGWHNANVKEWDGSDWQ